MDDGKRAVAAALALVERMSAIGGGLTCSVGVASGERDRKGNLLTLHCWLTLKTSLFVTLVHVGKAFCGVIGSKERREYTVSRRISFLLSIIFPHFRELG